MPDNSSRTRPSEETLSMSGASIGRPGFCCRSCSQWRPCGPTTPPTAPRRNQRLVREAKVNPDAAGLLGFFRKRTLSDDDRRAMIRLVRQLGNRSFALREAASRKLEPGGRQRGLPHTGAAQR